MLSAWSSMGSVLPLSESESIACVAKTMLGEPSSKMETRCPTPVSVTKRAVWRPHNPLVAGSSPSRPTK